MHPHSCPRVDQSEDETFPRCYLIRECEEEIIAMVQEQIARTLVDEEGFPISHIWLGISFQQKMQNVMDVMGMMSTFTTSVILMVIQIVSGTVVIFYSTLLI